MVVPAVIDEVLEQRSKSLFGNRHMLRLARDVAERRKAFTTGHVEKACDIPYSTAHRLLRQLESIGLVTAEPAAPPDQTRWYTKTSHKFWGAATQLCETVPGAGRSEVGASDGSGKEIS